MERLWCGNVICKHFETVMVREGKCNKCDENSLFSFPRDIGEKDWDYVYDYRTWCFSMDVCIEPENTAFCYTIINIPLDFGKHLIYTGWLTGDDEMHEMDKFYLNWYDADSGTAIFLYQVPIDEPLTHEELLIFNTPNDFSNKALENILKWMKNAKVFPMPKYIQTKFKKGYKIFAHWLIKNTANKKIS